MYYESYFSSQKKKIGIAPVKRRWTVNGETLLTKKNV